jgi:hypothetical protein
METLSFITSEHPLALAGLLTVLYWLTLRYYLSEAWKVTIFTQRIQESEI